MKFRLGLIIGGTAGYLLGSGKGAEMWADYKDRASGGAGTLASGSRLDFTEPVVQRTATPTDTFSTITATDATLMNDEV